MKRQPKRHMELEPTMTVDQLAEHWHKCRVTIRRMIHARQFAGVRKIGRDFLIPLKSIEAFERRAIIGRRKPNSGNSLADRTGQE